MTLGPPLASLSGTAFGAHARSLQFVPELAGEDIGEQVVLARLADRRVDRAGGGAGGAGGDEPTPFVFGATDGD